MGGDSKMATVLDYRGLKCPQPTLKLTKETVGMSSGETVEVVADCNTFEDDIKKWCDRMKKTLVWIRDDADGAKRCQVRL